MARTGGDNDAYGVHDGLVAALVRPMSSDDPARPGSEAGPESEASPGSEARPEGRGWPPGRRQWYVAAAITAGVALLAGSGAALLTISRAPAIRPLADDCGLVACGASLPRSVTGQAVRSTAQAARPSTAAHRPTQVAVAHAHSRGPRPTPTPRPPNPTASPPLPTPSPPQQPPGPPRVTVSYTLDDGGRGHRGFHAHLTIVNNGRRAIAGWTLQLTLPGDQVNWVGYPGAWGPFAAWQFSGATLTLHAASGGETLPPGGTEIVPLLGGGDGTAPSGCSFNDNGC
jgi:Cellulose binding domain